MLDTTQEQMRQEMEAAEEGLEFTPVIVRGQFPPDVLAKFQITETQLKDMAQRYAGLTIAGPEDKKGFAVVHAARMETRDARLLIEKTRKNLNEDAQAWIKTCNGAAKHLAGIITPTEDRLDALEEAYEAEQERIKAEKQREKDAELQRRIDALTAVGHPVTVGDLVTMPATTFAMVLQTATEAFQIRERERLAAEAALEEKRKAEAEAAARAAEEKAQAEKAERERQAQIAAENAKEAARLAAQREEMRKAQEAIDAQRRALEQAAREEQIRKDAEAKAKADAERRAEEERIRKAAEALAAEKLEAEAAQRKKDREAARPDAEKLQALAESLRGTAWPNMVTDAGKAVLFEAKDMMARYCDHVFKKAGAIADTKVMP